MKWDGVTKDHYEAMRKSVQWEPDVPKGAVFHVAAFTDKGIRVTDIWESPEELNEFVEKRLMPGAIAANVPGQPEVEVYPVHAIFCPDTQKLS